MSTGTGSNYYELYRKSSIGIALMDALDELIQSGLITPQLAIKILQQFDKSASTTFSSNLKTKCTTKGSLKIYRLCDEVWTFVLKDATFKMDQDTIGPLEKVKIVACKGVAPDAKA